MKHYIVEKVSIMSLFSYSQPIAVFEKKIDALWFIENQESRNCLLSVREVETVNPSIGDYKKFTKFVKGKITSIDEKIAKNLSETIEKNKELTKENESLILEKEELKKYL